MNLNYAPYNQDLITSQPLDSNQLDTTNDDYRIMNDDSLPGPVKQIWSSIKDKQLFLIKQKQLNTVYINDFQQRDSNIEIINYINMTWQSILIYNLPPNVLILFKNKLLELNSILNKS
jgi:hypothetical protein